MDVPNEPGVYYDLAPEVYVAIDAINQSSLKIISDKSPMHYKQAETTPREPTKALDFGHAFHTAILEPDRFDAQYAGMISCPPRNTKRGKDEWLQFCEDNEGKTILEPGDYPKLMGMRKSVWARPDCQNLLTKARVEVTIIWRHLATGLLCKGRIDAVTPKVSGKWTAVLDVKSARDADRHRFAKAIDNNRYYYQMAFYVDGLKVLSDQARLPLFLAVEKTPPYACAIYEAIEDDLDLGRYEYEGDLATVRDCMESDKWPGYPQGIKACPMPPWRRRDLDFGQNLAAPEAVQDVDAA